MSDIAESMLVTVSTVFNALLLGGLLGRRVVIEGNIRTRFRRSAILLSGGLCTRE